jgi:hypothetical protein
MSVEYNHIPDVMKIITQEISDAVQAIPALIENDIKANMNKPHTGRIYKRRTITHQASAPREAPAIDTGTLVNSFQKKTTDAMHAEIYSNMEYSLALELGRPEHNLEPRPYMVPAAQVAHKQITRRMKQLKARIENV